MIQTRRTRFFFSTAVVLSCLFLLISFTSLPGDARPAGSDVEQIDAILNELRTGLQIPQEIQVTVVPANELMISVEHTSSKGRKDGDFVMSFDVNFLESLDNEELRAAIAHELGHVWIFSHHPYLQTEALANEIAMRVVGRDSLKKIYRKLWAHLGQSGSLDEFLGAEK